MRIRPRGSTGAPAIAIGAVVAVLAGACTHAWDALEPGGGGSSSSSSGGHGGASSSSTTSSGTGGETSTSSSASSSSASSSGTGGSPATHCGYTNLLSWDFSAAQPYVWQSNDFDLSGGHGVFTPDTNSTNWSVGTLHSGRAYDLRGDEVSIHVLDIPDQASEGWADFELDYDNGDDLYMGVYESEMACGYDRGGQEHAVVKQPYDPTAHAYWKLREDQGTIYCETSSDGSAWAPFGSFDLATSLLGQASGLRLRVEGGVPPMTAMPGQFVIDDLRGGPLPASWCPTSSFSDGFSNSTDVPGPSWDRAWADQQGDSFDLQGDQLNFHFGASQYSSAGYQSSAAYDLTGERVAIQVVKVHSADMTGSFFALGNDDDHDVYWDVHADSIICSYDNDSGNFDLWTGPLPALPVWLGIRESGGLTYCEVYENGAWTTKASIASPMDARAVDAVIGTYVWGSAAPGAGVASFDGYNLGP